MMSPLKSTSMVLGVGIALPQTQWSRCDSCPSRDRCSIVGKLAEPQPEKQPDQAD
jgi:hypothetical protein